MLGLPLPSGDTWARLPSCAAPGRTPAGWASGWALVWRPRGVAVRYLIALGFRFDYRADGVRVYRPRW